MAHDHDHASSHDLGQGAGGGRHEVRRYLLGLPGGAEVHDLHIWAMSTTEVALTAHLVMPGASYHASFLHDAGRALHDTFRIDHTTLQVEPTGALGACRQADEGAV